MGRCDENKGNLRPAPYFGLDGVDADGEAAGEDGLVEIEGVALCAEIVVANLDGAAALEGCPLAGDIDGAAGIDVAEGEAASHKARFEEAQAKKAAQQYPFQGETFASMSYTFQPCLSRPSWA